MVFQSDTYSVLLVTGSEKFQTFITPLLPSTDYWPVETVKNIGAARRTLAEREFDLVVVNSPLPDDPGIRFAGEVCTDSDAGVLFLVRQEQYEDIYHKLLTYGVVTLSKPTNAQMVAQNLRVLCAIRERLRRAEKKQLSVEAKMEEIRLMNRAKWLLVEKRGLTEPEAHRYLEKQAMDRCISKREIAQQLLEELSEIKEQR